MLNRTFARQFKRARGSAMSSRFVLALIGGCAASGATHALAAPTAPIYPVSVPYPSICDTHGTPSCCAYASWTAHTPAFAATCDASTTTGQAFDASTVVDKVFDASDTVRSRATLSTVHRVNAPVGKAATVTSTTGGSYSSQTLARSLALLPQATSPTLASSVFAPLANASALSLTNLLAADVAILAQTVMPTPVVHSCADFVDKRWWDYTQFVTMLRRYGTDYEGAFQAAFHDTAYGIGDNRALRAVSAAGWVPQPLSLPAAQGTFVDATGHTTALMAIHRNPFFLPLSASVQAMLAGRPAAPGYPKYIAPTVAASAYITPPAGTLATELDLHRLVADSIYAHFGDVYPAEYSAATERANAFAKLLVREAHLAHDLYCHDNAGAPACNPSFALEIYLASQETQPVVKISNPTPPIGFGGGGGPQPGVGWTIASPIATAARAARISMGAFHPIAFEGSDPLAVREQLGDVAASGYTFSHLLDAPLVAATAVTSTRLAVARQVSMTQMVLQGASALHPVLASRALVVSAGAPIATSVVSAAIAPTTLAVRSTTSIPVTQIDLVREQLALQLDATRQQISDAYLSEIARGDYGCTWSGDPSKNGVSANLCDWSPKLFVDRFSHLLDRQRESEFGECVKYTGDDFSPTGLINNPAKQASLIYPLDFRGRAFTSSIGQTNPAGYLDVAAAPAGGDRTRPEFVTPGVAEFIEHVAHRSWYLQLQNDETWRAVQRLQDLPLERSTTIDSLGRKTSTFWPKGSHADASTFGSSDWIGMDRSSSSSWSRAKDVDSYVAPGGTSMVLKRWAPMEKTDSVVKISGLGAISDTPISFTPFEVHASTTPPTTAGADASTDSTDTGHLSMFDIDIWERGDKNGNSFTADPSLELDWSLFGADPCAPSDVACRAANHPADPAIDIVKHWYSQDSATFSSTKPAAFWACFKFVFDGGFLFQLDAQFSSTSALADKGANFYSGTPGRASGGGVTSSSTSATSLGFTAGIFIQGEVQLAAVDWFHVGAEGDLNVFKISWNKSHEWDTQASTTASPYPTFHERTTENVQESLVQVAAKVYAKIDVPFLGEKGVEYMVKQSGWLKEWTQDLETHEANHSFEDLVRAGMVGLQE